jgi:hypothetical protein
MDETSGRYADAERTHRRAVAIREQIVGADQKDVAESLNNLARRMPTPPIGRRSSWSGKERHARTVPVSGNRRPRYVVPAEAGPHIAERWLWVPAFAVRQEMDDAVLARRALARLIVELLPTGLRVL